VDSGNLSFWYTGVYYFNFSEDFGSYLVQVCDGSTRQINVGGGDLMFIIAIILLPLFIGLVLLYWGSQLTEEHAFLKFLFQMFQIPLFILSVQFAIIAIGEYSGSSEFINNLAAFVEYLSYFIWIVGAYIMIYLVWKSAKNMLDSIKKKKEERHGD
jgi:uncharacterized membrane protein